MTQHKKIRINQRTKLLRCFRHSITFFDTDTKKHFKDLPNIRAINTVLKFQAEFYDFS
jgi:hypothetical protein